MRRIVETAKPPHERPPGRQPRPLQNAWQKPGISADRPLPRLQCPQRLLICGSLILTLRDGHPARLRPLAAAGHQGRAGRARPSRSHRGAEPQLGRVRHLHGMLADRWGSFAVLIGGSLLWTLGLGAWRCRTRRCCSPQHRHACSAWRSRPVPMACSTASSDARSRRRSAPGPWALAGRRRLRRPVPAGADRGLADRQLRLAARLLRAGRVALVIGRWRCCRPAGSEAQAAGAHQQGIVRALREGLRLSAASAADGRLLRLRLPGRLHRRAHAELPEGPGWPCRHHRAGADRCSTSSAPTAPACWASAGPNATSCSPASPTRARRRPSRSSLALTPGPASPVLGGDGPAVALDRAAKPTR